MVIFDLGEDGPYVMVAAIRPGSGPRSKPVQLPAFLEAASSPAVSVQVLNSGAVAGYEHILTAAFLSAKSWRAGRSIARTPATEVLLYASGRRQISAAIEAMGVGGEDVAGWVVVAVSRDRGSLEEVYRTVLGYGREDESLLEVDDKKCRSLVRRFSITPNELSTAELISPRRADAVKAIVLERVALSDLYR